ncbi:MAG TPA: alpha/beta hydrolase [Candidatus Thermoplasmatota archaeon]|nr:alpha/beta hydrolase [Candidatus Thermoplasmatota archaeon]
MADLSYAVHGPRDGPALLLIHGFPFDRAMWRFQVGPLTAAGYRVVVAELPGFGRTEEVGSPVQPLDSVDAMATELLRLLDRLRISKAVPVGFSMGGYVALALAAQAKDRLAGLVLIDTRAEADSDEGRKKRDATIADVQKHGTRALAMAMLANQLTEPTRTGERLLAEEVRAMMLRQPKATVAGALKAMRDRPDRRDLLPTLSCPVLVVVGDQDKVTPLDCAKTMLGASRAGELVVVEGAAHLSPMERPDDVNEALIEWLRKHVPVTP